MSTNHAILALNCGSSSIKFALFPLKNNEVGEASVSGYLDLSPDKKNTQVQIVEAHMQTDLILSDSPCGVETVLVLLADCLRRRFQSMRILAIAHRVVHGGERFSRSIVLNLEALAYLATLSELTPLHQLHNLAGVRAFTKAFPQAQQIACFDTGFHADLPILETLVPLPIGARKLGIRRFGFHGLSYRYVVDCLTQHSGTLPQRIVVAHLGNGASVCGILAGKSHAISMGFSALDGLMMGSRCGSLDPGILLYLMKRGMQYEALETMLYRDAGLVGVSGVSSDMRILRASPNPSAHLAIDLFTHRLVREIGATVACLGGIDALIFTGGIGENDAILRQETCAALSYLGLIFDPMSNLSDCAHPLITRLHAQESGVEIWVVPTNEAKVLAQDAMNLISMLSLKTAAH